MTASVFKPRYVVEESGLRTHVVLTVRMFRRLLCAWEEVTDARDFAEAKRNARTFAPATVLTQSKRKIRKRPRH